MNLENDQQLDCVVRVVTPENIEFDYLLAGPFQRLPAFIADFSIRALTFCFLVVLGVTFSAIAGSVLTGFEFAVVAFLFILFFLFSWAYGAVMETLCNGRTLGKMLFKLRVISTDGRPISAIQATLRNLLRACDMFPALSLQMLDPEAAGIGIIPTFFVGLVAMTLTTRMQRLGDLAAGTMVISFRRRGVSSNLQPDDARAFALADHIPPTYQVSPSLARVAGLYMERRKFLHPVRRAELAANVAEPLIREFGLLPDTSTDLLMVALYVRIYHSESAREDRLNSTRSVVASPLRTRAPIPTPIRSIPMQPLAAQHGELGFNGTVLIADQIGPANSPSAQHLQVQPLDILPVDRPQTTTAQTATPPRGTPSAFQVPPPASQTALGSSTDSFDREETR